MQTIKLSHREACAMALGFMDARGDHVAAVGILRQYGVQVQIARSRYMAAEHDCTLISAQAPFAIEYTDATPRRALYMALRVVLGEEF